MSDFMDFRYLGLPISTPPTSVHCCQPENVKCRIEYSEQICGNTLGRIPGLKLSRSRSVSDSKPWQSPETVNKRGAGPRSASCGTEKHRKTSGTGSDVNSSGPMPSVGSSVGSPVGSSAPLSLQQATASAVSSRRPKKTGIEPSATGFRSVATSFSTGTEDLSATYPPSQPTLVTLPAGRETPLFVKHESIQTSPSILSATKPRTRSAFAAVRPVGVKSPPTIRIPKPPVRDTNVDQQSLSRSSSDEVSRVHHHGCPHNYRWSGSHGWNDPWAYQCQHQCHPLHNTCCNAYHHNKGSIQSVSDRSRHKTLASARKSHHRGSKCAGFFINISKDDWKVLVSEAWDKINNLVHKSRGTIVRERVRPDARHAASEYDRLERRANWDSRRSSADASRWFDALCNEELREPFSRSHIHATSDNYPHSYATCFHRMGEGGTYLCPIVKLDGRRYSFYNEGPEEFYDCETPSCPPSHHLPS